MTTPTFKIGATDLSTTAYITSFEGILQNGPMRGDIIELDFVAGAEWQASERATYSYDVPFVMKDDDPADALVDLRALQALDDGTEYTLTRVLPITGGDVTETQTGVITSFTVVWDFGDRRRVGAVLTIQATSEWS